MAYTDPRTTYEFTSLDGTPVEFEATADILRLKGSVSDAATGSDADLDSVRCPAGASIEDFGLIITEALTGGHATNCVLALKVVDIEGGTTTTVATITLPADSSEITLADVRPTDRTAAQAVAAGARLISSDPSLPYEVPPGGRFYLEVTQAAGTLGGAFHAFVIARQNGGAGPTTASPVTTIAS